MSTVRIVVFSLFVHLIILINYVGFVFATPCNRVPLGTGAGKAVPTGNFGLSISGDSNFYQPGRQYIISIERKNLLRSRESGRPKFIGFFLAIERSDTPPSDYAEEFSPATHGKLLVDEDFQALVKLICGNVATHYLDTPKSEVRVNWTAPEPGAGTLSLRATIIEARDTWYMDGIFLSKELQEDKDSQDDYISDVLDTCTACTEAKYELSFEGLWSKNTHPKNFPDDEFGAKFGDIIGSTHQVGSHFWTNGDRASDGFKELADSGDTRKLEEELKNMSSNIRTIIKARGLSDPKQTTKTLAVFRVDKENHLVSFVSSLLPSPDWFVGISALELCTSDGNWIESRLLDLYPWDAGTDLSTTYKQKIPILGERREFIRRITSDWPASKDSPFYDENGIKMKPLARLTLSLQRLYEKGCDDDESETESIFNDPDCDESVSFSTWSQCTPKCRRYPDQMGTQTRVLRYKSPEAQDMCERRLYQRTRECEIQDVCVEQNPTEFGQDFGPTPQQTDDDQYQNPYQTTTEVYCEGTYRKDSDSECVGICGIGEMNRTLISTNPRCEPRITTEQCNLAKRCENKDLCSEMLDARYCRRARIQDPSNPPSPTNLIYYNATSCTCMVFTTYCLKEEGKNIFETFGECTEACQIGPLNCGPRFSRKGSRN